MNERIIVYSRRSGANVFLMEVYSIHEALDLFKLEHGGTEYLKEHKDYAYVLLDGVEIKLFES